METHDAAADVAARHLRTIVTTLSNTIVTSLSVLDSCYTRVVTALHIFELMCNECSGGGTWPDGCPVLNSPIHTRVLVTVLLSSHRDVRDMASKLLTSAYFTSGQPPIGLDHADHTTHHVHAETEDAVVDATQPLIANASPSPSGGIGRTASATDSGGDVVHGSVGNTAQTRSEQNSRADRAIVTATAMVNGAWELVGSMQCSSIDAGVSLLTTAVRHYVVNHPYVVVRSADRDATGHVPWVCITAAHHAQVAPTGPAPTSSDVRLYLVLTSLVDELHVRFEHFQDNLLTASEALSLHGLLLLVQKTWELLPRAQRRQTHAVGCVAECRDRLLGLALRIGRFALGLLSLAPAHGSDDVQHPVAVPNSVADVEAAISAAIASEQHRVHSPEGDSDNGVGAGASCTRGTDVVVTKRILNLAWKSLKEVAALLATVLRTESLVTETSTLTRMKSTTGGTLQSVNSASGVTLALVAEMGALFQDVLHSVHHKGVIVHCSESFAGFCQRLHGSTCTHVRELPRTWLRECLVYLSHHQSISVTRRGAGVPHLVKALLAGCRNADVIVRTADEVLAIASSEHTGATAAATDTHGTPDAMHPRDTGRHAPGGDGVVGAADGEADPPHVRAMHVLNVLFCDSFIAGSLQSRCPQALTLAINGFASDDWLMYSAA